MGIMSSPEYRENVLLHLMENDSMTLANGIVISKASDMDRRFKLRAVVDTTKVAYFTMPQREGDVDRHMIEDEAARLTAMAWFIAGGEQMVAWMNEQMNEILGDRDTRLDFLGVPEGDIHDFYDTPEEEAS